MSISVSLSIRASEMRWRGSSARFWELTAKILLVYCATCVFPSARWEQWSWEKIRKKTIVFIGICGLLWDIQTMLVLHWYFRHPYMIRSRRESLVPITILMGVPRNTRSQYCQTPVPVPPEPWLFKNQVQEYQWQWMSLKYSYRGPYQQTAMRAQHKVVFDIKLLSRKHHQLHKRWKHVGLSENYPIPFLKYPILERLRIGYYIQTLNIYRGAEDGLIRHRGWINIHGQGDDDGEPDSAQSCTGISWYFQAV